MNTTAHIKTRINHDSMWFQCRFETGGQFRFKVTRYSSELTGTSMGGDIDEDLHVILEWITKRHTSSYGNLFKDLEKVCRRCNTGLDLIELMKKQIT